MNVVSFDAGKIPLWP